jgi:prephenate dehydratase/prephenate dehydrogenase
VDKKNKKIAFLGPVGTYSHLAQQRFFPSAKGIPCRSIAEIFKAVASGTVNSGLVPIENQIQGPITETLDYLLENKGSIKITNSHLLPIEHCLGYLPKNKTDLLKINKIKKVYSHSQPLYQCSVFLSSKARKAQTISTPSTAEAIKMVSSSGENQVAVIAAKTSLEQAGFKIIAEKIADVPDNKTRFVLIEKKSKKTILPKSSSKNTNNFVTSIAVNPKRDRQGLLFELLRVISVEHGVNMLTIHSRPDAKGGFVFFFDLEGSVESKKIANCLTELKNYCLKETGETVEITIFGSYNRDPFHSVPFKTIAIIGGKGQMGVWFDKFFTNAGFKVLIHDLDTKIKLEKTISKADIVLLSLPMGKIASFSKKIFPLLKPGQLVVENGSIKNCSLPAMIANIPKDIELLGMHTMFGGNAKALKDQNVIFTKTKYSGTKSQAFEDLFYKFGAQVSEATIETHDHISSFVQALVHFNMVCMAEVLRVNFNSLQDIELLSTPNSRALFNSMKSIVDQNAELLDNIQILNKQTDNIRNQFAKIVAKHSKSLKSKDSKEFLNSAKKSSGFLRSKK